MSGRPTECRYCRYPAPKGRCHGNHVLAFYIWGAHWRHLANTTKPSMCGGDAALVKLLWPLVETTALIPTRYCTVINTTKHSLWVVQTCTQEIQDGGRPPF